MLDLGYLNKLINNKQTQEANDIVNCVKKQFPIFEEAVECFAKLGAYSGNFKLWLPEDIRRVTNDIIYLAFITLKNAYQPLDIRFCCGVTTYETDFKTNRKYLDLLFTIPNSKAEVKEYGDRVVWEAE